MKNIEANQQYIYLMHISSSIHQSEIKKKGLRPTNFSKQNVKDYISDLVCSGKRPLLFKELMESSYGAAGLVRSRLFDTQNRLCFLTCRKGAYYSNIIDTVKDGGEFFTAIRKAVEHLTNEKIEPLHVDAYPIICIVKFKLEISEDELKFVVSADGLNKKSLPDIPNPEVSLDYSIAPEEIEILTEDQFINSSYYV